MYAAIQYYHFQIHKSKYSASDSAIYSEWQTWSRSSNSSDSLTYDEIELKAATDVGLSSSGNEQQSNDNNLQFSGRKSPITYCDLQTNSGKFEVNSFDLQAAGSKLVSDNVLPEDQLLNDACESQITGRESRTIINEMQPSKHSCQVILTFFVQVIYVHKFIHCRSPIFYVSKDMLTY